MSDRALSRIESIYCLTVVAATFGLVASMAVSLKMGFPVLRLSQFFLVVLLGMSPVGILMELIRRRNPIPFVVVLCIAYTSLLAVMLGFAWMRGAP